MCVCAVRVFVKKNKNKNLKEKIFHLGLAMKSVTSAHVSVFEKLDLISQSILFHSSLAHCFCIYKLGFFEFD